MKCPYCQLRKAKTRYVPASERSGYFSYSCDVCQKKVDKAVKNTGLVQRGLLRKYLTLPVEPVARGVTY